jgi:hypothetical protein
LKPANPKDIPAQLMDAPAIAGEAVRNWDQVQSRLAPIIGENGFRVLYARSLHRARLEHAWLARGPSKANAFFSSLKKSLESQTPEHAAQGCAALASHFDELLHALIGEELATRLIGPV